MLRVRRRDHQGDGLSGRSRARRLIFITSAGPHGSALFSCGLHRKGKQILWDQIADLLALCMKPILSSSGIAPESDSVIHCAACGSRIQAATAERTGGLCMPCERMGQESRSLLLRLLRFLIPLLALACMGLVGTIEVLNLRCGGAIARKMQQEPDSKWRILAPRSAWLLYERDFKASKGIGSEAALSTSERQAFDYCAKSRWKAHLPYHLLGHAMKYSTLGIPGGFLAGLGSLVLLSRSRPAWRPVFMVSGMVGIIAFLTCLLRYRPVLGW